MAEDAKWYVIHTYSGYENKVASNIEKTVQSRKIQNLIQEVKVPTETVIEIKDNKERKVERKAYPGYVLVKMVLSNKTWHIVKSIRGVNCFVGYSAKPVPLTPEEVKNLGVERREIRLSYNVGESVRILEGPLANMVGKVSEINIDTKTVKVVVSMFGRETPANLKLGQIEPIM